MKLENHYFDVTPKVIPADREAVVTIAPRFDHCRFREDRTYALTYAPVEEWSVHSGWMPLPKIAVRPENGRIEFRQYFEGEQEHVLYLEEIDGETRRVVGRFSGLFRRGRPFRPQAFTRATSTCNTCRSDGVESPDYVAGACRSIGLDLVAITDHRQYGPSLEAQRAFDGVEIDLRLFPAKRCTRLTTMFI